MKADFTAETARRFNFEFARCLSSQAGD